MGRVKEIIKEMKVNDYKVMEKDFTWKYHKNHR